MRIIAALMVVCGVLSFGSDASAQTRQWPDTVRDQIRKHCYSTDQVEVLWNEVTNTYNVTCTPTVPPTESQTLGLTIVLRPQADGTVWIVSSGVSSCHLQVWQSPADIQLGIARLFCLPQDERAKFQSTADAWKQYQRVRQTLVGCLKISNSSQDLSFGPVNPQGELVSMPTAQLAFDGEVSVTSCPLVRFSASGGKKPGRQKSFARRATR